jgi:hypothetical protein
VLSLGAAGRVEVNAPCQSPDGKINTLRVSHRRRTPSLRPAVDQFAAVSLAAQSMVLATTCAPISQARCADYPQLARAVGPAVIPE